ncbi:hypothetical protein FC652_11005 [Vibrio sp. 05-20-BW147]|nr:hypothetical protein [Vibrio sp. 05-20-BW147]
MQEKPPFNIIKEQTLGIGNASTDLGNNALRYLTKNLPCSWRSKAGNNLTQADKQHQRVEQVVAAFEEMATLAPAVTLQSRKRSANQDNQPGLTTLLAS